MLLTSVATVWLLPIISCWVRELRGAQWLCLTLLLSMDHYQTIAPAACIPACSMILRHKGMQSNTAFPCLCTSGDWEGDYGGADGGDDGLVDEDHHQPGSSLQMALLEEASAAGQYGRGPWGDGAAAGGSGAADPEHMSYEELCRAHMEALLAAAAAQQVQSDLQVRPKHTSFQRLVCFWMGAGHEFLQGVLA